MNVQMWPDFLCRMVSAKATKSFIIASCVNKESAWLHETSADYLFLSSKSGYLIYVAKPHLELLSTEAPIIVTKRSMKLLTD